MIRHCAVELAFLACALSSLAQPATDEAIWKDADGNAVPNTEFRASKEGFGGWLFITPDAGKEKWETSPETVPRFNTADKVGRGERLFILIFFSNPKLDGQNNADITCAGDVKR